MMKFISSKLLPMFLLLGFVAFTTSCNSDDDDPMDGNNNDPKSIVETAQSADQFSSLVAALTKADLVSTVEGGTFTVFAPTNTAFDQLFTDLGVSGLDDLTKEQLTPILLYHVVAGKVTSDALSSGYVGTASTGPNSQPLKVKVDVGSTVTLNNNSTVTTADIEATNGVIHEINRVILPPSIVDLVLGNDKFSILVSALTRQDLTFDFVDFLSGDGPFTVFAPTNDAFVALLESNPDWNSLDDIPAMTLDAVLKYHVIANQNFESTALSDGVTVPTASNGATITINTTDGVKITSNGNGVATVMAADIQGTNGVIHEINKVLVP